MNEDRIKLAEAMGYKTTRQTEEWHGPTWEGLCPLGERTWRLPDPFTDANDCEALIRFLGARGMGIDIYMRPWMDAESVVVYMQGEPVDWKERRWTGDDWKQGVCELALAVLKDEEGQANG